ncbi:MAG: MoaD/ThiS family protein [Candidatus Bathyarchaeia archaeon]
MHVKYFAVMREIAGKGEETIEFAASLTLLELLKLLAIRYGMNMETYVFDRRTNTPRPILQYLVDGRTFTASQTSTTVLNDESVVSIIPTQGG